MAQAHVAHRPHRAGLDMPVNWRLIAPCAVWLVLMLLLGQRRRDNHLGPRGRAAVAQVTPRRGWLPPFATP